jgi:Tol biopolymer transport system component
VSVRRSPATGERGSPQWDAQEDGTGAQEREERPAATARLAAAFVALLLAATGTLVAIGAFRGIAPPPPASAAANGRIAYVAGDDADVYLTDPEGGGSSRIIQRHGAAHEGGVAMTWSPDGTRVAFTDWTSADTRLLYAMDSDGTELVELSAGLIDADSPAWSPDGSQIAFTGVDSEHGYEIYVVEANGTRRSRLTDEADNGVDGAHMPAWSPDGARIAYTANGYDVASQTETQAIFTMGTDGSGRVQVTDRSEIDEVPVWSPDGAKIAFARKSGDDSEVFVANAEGTGLVNVSNHPALDWPASWSPDGTGILLVSGRGGDFDIYLAALDGRLTRLTDDPGDDLSPAWSPDATAIAFASDRAGSLDIYVMNTDGTDVTRDRWPAGRAFPRLVGGSGRRTGAANADAERALLDRRAGSLVGGGTARGAAGGAAELRHRGPRPRGEPEHLAQGRTDRRIRRVARRERDPCCLLCYRANPLRAGGPTLDDRHVVG